MGFFGTFDPEEKRKEEMMKKNKILTGSLAALLAAGVLAGAPATAFADAPSESGYSLELHARDERMLALSYVHNKNAYAYARSAVYVRGTRLSVASVRINGIDYIPFRAAANAIGAAYSYNSAEKTSVMRLSGLTVSATDGNYAVMANDRPLFAMSPIVIMSDGRMYIPATAFAKATGLSLSVGEGVLSLTGGVKPLAVASRFYREDEVFWLARIIHAESSGEPLIGKIAVGNVVLNRVRSAYYPNTIYGVIFDRKYGVQFSPVANGAIYNTPSYASYLAAKICLEGFDLSEGAFFFLRPELSSSSWIPDSREYLFTVGKHDFYK